MRIPKKALLAGLLLTIVLLLAGAYVVRRDIYLLNRNVRLVCMRLLRYAEFSLHRRYPYRIQFNKEDYRVFAFRPDSAEKWEEVKTFAYERSIEAAQPGLILEFKDGRLASYDLGEGREALRSYVILYFRHRKDPSRQKGIIFRQSGEWKAL